MTPEQTKNAQRAEEAARLRRNEDMRDSADGDGDGRDLRSEINANSRAADGGRRSYDGDSQANASPYGNIDNLPRPPPLVAFPPPFFRAGSDRVGTGMPRGYVPYMERGSAYKAMYQDSNTNLNPFKDKAKEENRDDDPHYIEEDAIFEFWLANIWKPVDPIRAQEERKEVVVKKKGWFRGLWSVKK